MTWALIIWSALILLWAIVGGASNKCGDETTPLNQSACEAGTGIGVALVLFIGFIGFVFLSLIWLMTRPKGRDCPVCGEKVKKGIMVCGNCSHDFAAAAGLAAAGQPTGAAAAVVHKPADSAPEVSPGWHPDPRDSSSERYWDGNSWTDKVRKLGEA